MKAEDFMMEETAEEKDRRILKKGLDGAKQVAYEMLGRANGLYKRALKGDPSPTLVGKAIAYLTCFMDLAKVVGIPELHYKKIVQTLYERLGDLMIKVEENSRTTIVQHRRDPEGIKIEAERVEVAKKEIVLRELQVTREAEPKPAPPVGATTIEEMVGYLKSLGYDKNEARMRAEKVYRPDARIEDLVAAACRV
jgi:hypothetical protein